MTFKELNIIEPILKALQGEGYDNPTPIQTQSIPILLSGKDLLGSAQTGTGKTAAFAVPILQNIYLKQMQNRSQNTGNRPLKALVLAPTRELAAQIGDSFGAYGKNLGLRKAVIFGGVNQKPQVELLRNGVDILIATPGRLLDLMDQKIVHLNNVEYLVLDEADRMLDMGFVIDVKKIIAKVPTERQTMLFSATMPKEINILANTILKNPVRIAVTPVEATVDAIKQSVFLVKKKDKTNLLIHLLKDEEVSSALVFSRTKHGANKIMKDLVQAGIKAAAIHGNKSQSARTEALNDFKSKKIKVLVATDIAARGIDIDELSHVINYDLPEVPETYIHRIGRTGRAGLGGTAFSFVGEQEIDLINAIQKHINMTLPVNTDHPYAISMSMLSSFQPAPVKFSHSRDIPKSFHSSRKPKRIIR